MQPFAVQVPCVFRTAVADAPVFVEPHPQPALEITLVLEGSIVFLVDGAERTVSGPAATLSVCRQSLGVTVPAQRLTRAIWCNCRGVRLSEAEWAWWRGIPPVQAMTDRLLHLFHAGLASGERGTQPDTGTLFATQVRDALGLAVFAEYLRQAGAVPLKLPPRILALKRHIDEHYAHAWDIDRLARFARLSPQYLIEQFRKHVGDSPMRYLWRRRVEAGVSLLRTTHDHVDTIAHRCGFQSAAHFSRKVKEEYRQSPSEIRRSYASFAN